MFGGVGQYLKELFGGPPKANQTDKYRQEWNDRQKAARPTVSPTQRLERVIGPLSEHPRMAVKGRPAGSNPSFYSTSPGASSATSSITTLQATNAPPAGVTTPAASGSTGTLTPSVPQQPTQPPGTVPVRNASDLQNSLNNVLGLVGRSKGLKSDMESLGDRCKVLIKLLDGLDPEMRSASKFGYEFTKMNQDLEDIGQFLNEFNKKNMFRQAAARKDVRLQIAKLSHGFSNHLDVFMAICQDSNSKLQGQKMDGMREQLEALQSIQNRARERLNLDNVDQVEDSELMQHVKDVTGHEPQNSFLLKGQIRYRESVAISPGLNFDVYKGRMIDGEDVAIKLYREKILNDGKGMKFVERIMRQVEFWTSFQHPSIVPCYGIGMQITRAPEGSGAYDKFQFYLVSPFMRNGNAVHFIEERRQRRAYVDILRIIRQAALGIQYLHSRKPQCIHASMRGENVLIKDDGTACINGFGLTKALSETKRTELTGKNLQYRWMAPELILKSHPLLKPSCDIWSWAMTALELISGKEPYYNFETQLDFAGEIAAGRVPNESDYPAFREYSPQPDMMWALFQKCWNMKPEDRPTIDQVIDELDLIEKAQIEAQAEQGHRWT